MAEADVIDLSNIDYKEEAYFTYRCNLSGNFDVPVSKPYRDLEWATPNCHTFGYLMAPDPFADDSYLPDAYPCLTSDSDRQLILNNLQKYIDRYIESNGTDPDIISLSYTDNSYYCKCDKCEEINTKYDSPAATLVLFMNEVCEMYEDDYPDMKVQTLAYWHTLKPPIGLKAHKNVVVQYCTISSCYNHSLGYKCYFNGIEGEQIAGWANVADELYCWDYAWNWAFHAVPYPILSYADVMEKHQWLYENNVRLMFQNCGGGRDGNFQQVCSYMYNLAIWNPYMSEDLYYEHMMDACLAFYGDGGKYVYDAINLLEEKYDRCLISEQTPSAALMHMYMKNYIDELISKMESARLLAETKYQWENVDCAMMQFEHVKIDGEFKAMYNSTDTAVRAELQDMCKTLYAKYLRYNLGVSNEVPNFPMPSEFGASPSGWRTFAFACVDKNGDGVQDDWYYDKNGNWLYDTLPWDAVK